MIEKITSSYIHALQAKFHRIDNRGLRCDRKRLEEAARFIESEITRNCAIASGQWACHVYVGADNKLDKDDADAEGQVNLNSTSGEASLLKKLQTLGYKVPKINKKNTEGEYEHKYSTAELALQKMLVENQFNHTGGDPAIRAVLAVRELTKLRSSYINCMWYEDPAGEIYYLTNYNCAGTLTGRRSSRKHSYGFGNNSQNFPKHGSLAKVFRRCLVSRPGNLFLNVDQKSAEEWPVSALGYNLRAIEEMKSGINRHIRRASYIFAIPEPSRDRETWKKSLEYYLGKKTGHANNYGMQPNRMSDSLAQEGHSISPSVCKNLLEKLNTLEPETKGVFHKYVQTELSSCRVLRTPFGRERQFMGLRPSDNNYSVFNEAYAYIPQSTVGDNNGFAVFYMEDTLPAEKRAIVNECHDSITLDIKDDPDTIWEYLQHLIKAYHRTLTFYNGIEIEIPMEAEIGYDFAESVSIGDLSYDGVLTAYKELRLKKEAELDTERQKQQESLLQDLAATV